MTAPNGPIRVLVADDHPVYLDGLVAAIKRAPDLELVATCRDGAAAMHHIRAGRLTSPCSTCGCQG
jgi:DNA-binding NarL/FixJ family response regulator